MRRYIIAALVLLTYSLAPGCAGRMSGEDAEQIRALVDEQARALNQGDMDAFLATIDPQAKGLDEAARNIKAMYVDLPSLSKIASFDFVTSNASSAQVRVVRESNRIESGFQTKRVTMLFSFRKIEGKWLMCGSEIEKDENYE